MDQLTPVIAWIKKNGFWLTCGILFAATVGVWFFDTGVLAKEQQTNESSVKSKISTVEKIMATKPVDLADEPDASHPNQSTEEGMQAELEETVDAIVKAWRMRVADQEEILVWPEVIGNEEFDAVFSRFNPAETFPKNYDVRIEGLLQLYKNNIMEHMNYLCGPELLRTNWQWDPDNFPEDDRGLTDDGNGDPDGGDFGAGEGGSGRGGLGGGGLGGGGLGGLGGMGGLGGGGLGGDDPVGGLSTADMVDRNQFAVIWSDVNQQLWHDKLTKFKGRDDHVNNTDSPTPLQCYMLQQDLWLLEAMFKIIRKINGDSNANDLSVIKEIDHIAFGREADKKLGELTPPNPELGPSDALDGSEITGRSAAGDYGEDDGDLGEDGDYGDSDSEGTVGYNSSAIGRPPFHRRYVDTNFEPLTSEEVLSVINATTLPEENLELIIAKRVPVRIALRMDERRIPDFMAECANSPFAFEIQQVRVNKHDPDGEEIPMGGFGGSNSGPNMAGASAGPGLQNGSQMKEAAPVEIRTSYDVNVEFYGIVKIYNPVREDFLRKAVGLDPESGAPATPAVPADADSAAAVSVPRDPRS